jgi:RsiW-degrading membrane proteinase PrsW (M82 family)
MAENVFFFLFLIATSAFCWLMVFRSSARRQLSEWAWSFYRLDKEGRETWDAMSLVSSLIGAMVFSLLAIAFIIVAVSRFFRR